MNSSLIKDLGSGLGLETQLEGAQVRVVIFRHSVHRVVHNLHHLLQFCLGTGVKVSPAFALLGCAVEVLARAGLQLVCAGAFKVAES